jgi:uncharacterized metal-binding protein YceD (DUF177 family)
MSAEWNRPERLDTIGEGERTVEIAADAAERAAVARRFDLVGVERLAATLAIRREAGGVLVTGRVVADVVQACSVTGEPLTVAVDEPVALRFVETLGGGAAGEEEIELSGDALDTVEIEGNAIDLGEAAAETMALALDPFPRGPGAAEALRQAGVVSEEEAREQSGPFGSLAGLKAKLEGK